YKYAPELMLENYVKQGKLGSKSEEGFYIYKLKPTAHAAEKRRAVDTRLEVTLRLLLVDDDPGLRALLRATLDAVDVEVDDAEDAPSARAAIGQQRPDAIVLDVNLPGMDGLAFCRQLKSERETKEIPIVVLSGSDGGTAEAALEAGAESFLRKPFSPLELLAVVERLAGGLYGVPFRATKKREPEEQLLLYARDLRHLLEIERGQRHLR